MNVPQVVNNTIPMISAGNMHDVLKNVTNSLDSTKDHCCSVLSYMSLAVVVGLMLYKLYQHCRSSQRCCPSGNPPSGNSMFYSSSGGYDPIDVNITTDDRASIVQFKTYH